jgi:hypothetical protein
LDKKLDQIKRAMRCKEDEQNDMTWYAVV